MLGGRLSVRRRTKTFPLLPNGLVHMEWLLQIKNATGIVELGTKHEPFLESQRHGEDPVPTTLVNDTLMR